jgi:hypothetical protein
MIMNELILAQHHHNKHTTHVILCEKYTITYLKKGSLVLKTEHVIAYGI